MLCMFIGEGMAFPDTGIILTDSTSLINIGRMVDVYEDRSTRLSFEDILSSEHQSRFVRSAKDVPSLGTTTSVLWIRIILQNKLVTPWFLRIENAYLDTIQLYIKSGDKIIKQETGKNFPFSSREIRSANYIFPLELSKDSVVQVYLRVRHHMTYVPLQIGQYTPIIERESYYNLFFGVFFGIVVIILLANFIMYFSIRDISLIWYIAYTTTFGLYAMIQKGYLVQLVPPSAMWISTYSPLLIYTSGIFVPLFGMTFLKARQLSPLFYKICIGMIIYGVVMIITYLLGYYKLSYRMISAYSLLATFIMVFFGGKLYIMGYKPARFFLIAYSFAVAGFIAIAIQATGGASNFFSQNAMQMSTLWEIIFFTVAIGDKTYILRKEKERAQSEALKAAKENESLLQNQADLLEQKVKDRTIELEIAQEQLIVAARQRENEKIRRRISQDIHDDISSGLNKISWMSERLKIKAGMNQPEEMNTHIDKIISTSRETVSHLIEIIWSLNPNSDDLENLLSYMRNYVNRFCEDTSLNIIIDFPEQVGQVELNPELRRNLFLVMKEAVHNAVKYSKARNLRIGFYQKNSSYRLCISDDGIGIEDGMLKGSGYGMINMKKRMEDIQGTFTLISAAGRGTEIILEGKFY